MNRDAVVATAQMLIRKPPAEVFEAFTNPDITTQFWFTKSSGRLETGKRVIWTWEMYNASALVDVKSIEPDKRIVVEWGDEGAMTTVEWTFTPHQGDTFVRVRNSGFKGTDDEIVAQVIDSTGGFTFLLAGLKAWLEHGLRLKLVDDHAPAGVGG